MASLAGLLKKAGHHVTGSDANVYPPMSTLLANSGIEIKPGYKKENITGEIDLVVVGNAVSKDNEEVLTVQAADIPYISMPQALTRFFLEGRKSLVVTGTHGKTTTSAILSWVFEACGKNPGFMVGGWLKNFDTNHKLPEGDWFVTEGDEYDTAFFDKGPKFLHYQPYAAILTSIEFDHADIYRDLGHIKEAFRKFMNIIDPKGFLLVEFSDKNTKDVINSAPCEVETYGFSGQADWQVADYRFEDGHGQFILNHKGKAVGQFHLPMIGRHNILNSAAVTALALKCGLAADAVAKGLKKFKGIKRRQEVVGEKNGVTVIDDFAHHPTAIHLTLEGAKDAWPGHRIWAVFEPRSATSRRKVFEQSLPDSFKLADQTIIAGLFAPDKLQAEERLDPKKVVATIKGKGREAWFFPTVEEIIDFVAEHQQSGDVVMIMSSGGFDGIHQKLLDRL